MEEPFKDRRKFVRIYRNFILSCRKKDALHVAYEMCQVNNISRGGVSFSSTHAFAITNELSIELKTPFISDKIDLLGTVVESKEKIKGMIYSIHVQFHHLTPQAVDILMKIEQYAAQQG